MAIRWPKPAATGDAAGADAPAGADSGVDATLVTTIRQLRTSQPPKYTEVALHGVVVVQKVTTAVRGQIWVQDVGGGTYSGIELFCNYGGASPNCTETKAQIDALAPGTVVDVVGAFAPFLPAGAPNGSVAVLELVQPKLTVTGTATAVAVDVPAATIDKAQLGSASDPYKGTYVHLTGATSFGSNNTAAQDFAATCTDQSTPPQTGATYDGFETNGGSATIAVSFAFFNTLTYCLPCTGVMNPYPCANPVTPTMTFTAVSGVVEPSFSTTAGTAFLQLQPTTNADL